MRKIITKMAAVALCMLFISTSAQAQNNSREFIRKYIEEWGECRNVAITKTNGDIALYGTNGEAHVNVPTTLSTALTQLNNAGEFIDDVQLTDQGSWLILYGDNGLRYEGIDPTLEKHLREYNANGEVITSVTFNDANQWIIISTNYILASEQWIQDWLTEGNEQYGKLWAACITDDAMVAVYEKGYKYYGEVPEDLKEALQASELNVFRLKIAGTAWFFADKDGNYRYNM